MVANSALYVVTVNGRDARNENLGRNIHSGCAWSKNKTENACNNYFLLNNIK